jgi:hypothetical protein
MPARGRQLGWLIGAAVLLLVVGRWTAVFVSTRLWEARVSESAALVGTRFALLTGALELAGVGTAVGWFLLNYLWAVQIALRHPGDSPGPFARFSERMVLWVTAAIAILVGIAIGGGTGGWLEPVLLAANGVTIGAPDPLLQVDLGLFLAKLPLWNLLHARAIAMYLPAALGVLVICLIGGLLTIQDRRLALAAAARWHMALLMIVGALLIGWGYALSPYRLAAERAASLGPAEFLLRTTVAQVVALFAATAAVLTFLWGARLRFTVALAGWVGLCLAMLGGTVIIQSRAVETPPSPAELKRLQRLDTLAYGIRATIGPPPTAAPADTSMFDPSLWDPEPLARIAEADSATVLGVLPGVVRAGARRARVWFVIRALGGGDPVLLAVADDNAGPAGGVISIRWGDIAFTPGLLPYVTLSRHHAMPGAPPFDLDPAAAGVTLGTTPRRVAVAWAQQVGRVLRARPNQRLAWRLDPVDRLTGIAPFMDWASPRVVVADREVYWISDGFATAARFPASRAVAWRGAERTYVRAGMIGVVRARGGDARVYLRADADSLSMAWSRIAAPLVEPISQLPEGIAAELGYPVDAAALQAHVLQGDGWTGRPIARIGRGSYPVDQLAAAGDPSDPHRIPFLDSSGKLITALLLAPAGDQAETHLAVVDSGRAVPAPRELQQRWDRFPFFQQLRDSIKAAGSEYQPGLIRYGLRGDTIVAYQPGYAIGPTGRTGLVLVNLALGPRQGSGRNYQDAWLNLRGETAPQPVGSDLTARLEEARMWLDRADAALKRGDLAEFGKAFSYLRELLAPPGTPPSSR